MAASQKQYELLFQLRAALGGNFNSTFRNAIEQNNKLSNSMKNVNSLQNKIDSFKKQQSAVQKNKDKLAELTAQHDKLQQEISQTENPSEALKNKLAKVDDQIKKTTASIEKQERQLADYKSELESAGVSTDNLESANRKLQKSYDKLKTAQETIANIEKKQESLKSSISSTKAELGKTVGIIAGTATAAYAGLVKPAQEFETSLNKVATIADTTKKPMSEMQTEIKKLSNATGIASKDIAEDIYNAISAGQKTEDAVNFVSNSTKLAKAGFASSAETLDVLTTILNAYGKEASEVGNVSDVLVQIQNKGKVTVQQLASVMGKVIPTAKANNVQLEQLGAAYAIMTSKGIAAAETTTYVNSMMNELGKSGSKTDKLLRSATGKGFADLEAEGKTLGDILGIVQKEAQKSGLTISDMFGSAEAGKAAVTLLANGVDGYNASVQDMINSKGATDAAFDIVSQGKEEKIQKAKNSIQNLAITLGTTLLPIIGQVADKVTPLIIKVTDYANANPKLVANVMKVVAGLAALKVGMLTTKLFTLSAENGILSIVKSFVGFRSGMVSGTSSVVSFIAKLKGAGGGLSGLFKIFKSGFGAFGGVVGKLLPIVGVITMIITAFKLLKNHLGEIRKWIYKTFGSEALEKFDKIVNGVLSVGKAFKSILSDGNIANVRQKIEETFGSKGTAVFDKLVVVIQKVVGAVKEVVSFINTHVVPVAEQVLSVIVNDIVPKIVSFIQAAAPIVMQIVSTIVSFVGDVVRQIGGFIASLMPVISQVVTYIQTNILPVVSQLFSFLVSEVFPVIASGIQNIASLISTILSIILPLIQTGVQLIWSFIQPIITKVMEAIQFVMPFIIDNITNVISTISGLIGGLQQILSGIIDFVTGVFTGNWQQAWEGIKSIFSGVFDGIKAICKGVMNGIINGLNGVIRGLNKLKVPDWVPGIGGKGVNIPEIPKFAKGTTHTPDTFIAGEKGAELVTNAPGRTVFTAKKTKELLEGQRKVQELRTGHLEQEVTNNALEVKTSSRGQIKQIVIENKPEIHINGNADVNELETKLEENNKNLLREVKEMLEEEEDKENRQRYD